jgi:hypothetical protein
MTIKLQYKLYNIILYHDQLVLNPIAWIYDTIFNYWDNLFFEDILLMLI